MRLPRSFFLWGKLKQLKSSLMDSGDGEVAVAQSLRSRLAVRVVSECSAEGVGEWNALGKRAGYCRLFGCFGEVGSSSLVAGNSGESGLDDGSEASVRSSSTETRSKCNPTAEDWSLVDVLKLTPVILR